MSRRGTHLGRGLGAVGMALLATVALLSVVSQTGSPRPALTASLTGAQWQAGNIVSDAVFYNSASMTATTIQTFLNAEGPSSCPSATCLKAFHMATTNQPAESGLCSAYAGRSSETAAQIFANVAAACGVNPQALLVIAQKESSAVSSSSPNYSTTMGYGCPDSTGCATKYFGFFNQVYLAARQFKLYRLHPTNYGYVAGESNYILYNPKVSCGGTQVVISNQATAGLYDYTPYQPNAAALANLHGTGDSCSAYGNRNFWVFFNNWFGNPTGVNPAPQPYDRGGLVVTKASDGSITYYGNNGTGSVLSAGVQVAANPQLSHLVAAGDVTGDGLSDLVATTASGTVLMFTNNGTAFPYGTPTQIAPSTWHEFNRMMVGDISGDGRADFLMTLPNGTVCYFPNSGSTAAPIGHGTQFITDWRADTSITLGDVNGDGFADVIATHADGSLWWLPASGNPASPFLHWLPLTANLKGIDTIVGDDTTADGLADLIARKFDGSLWLYRNSGSTATPYGVPTRIGSSTNWGAATTLESVTVPVPHRAEQANLIGRNPAGTGSLVTFANSSPPAPFSGPTVVGSGWQGFPLVTAANVFGTAHADAVAVDKNGAAWVYPTTFVASHPYSGRIAIGTGWGAIKTLIAGDVNGDGRDDLVARTSTGALELFINTGSSTAPYGQPVQLGTGWNAWPRLALADTNGDGKADLIAVSSAGVLDQFLGSGSTTAPFSRSTVIWPGGWQQFTQVIPITHATAAGLAPADLVAIRADGSGQLFRNSGLAGHPYLAATSITGKPWAGQTTVSSGFVTGTGRSDTLGSTASGSLEVDLNRGSDVFANPTVIGATGWDADNSIAVGDLTGDGRNDLVATTPAGALLLYFAGTDATDPYDTPVVKQSSGWQIFNRTLVGDVTGDGLADIVATEADGSLWLYQASHTTTQQPFAAIHQRQIGTGWQTFTQLALGDVTGDGLDDLVGVKADGSLWLAANQHNPAAPFRTPVQIGTGFQLYNQLLLGDVDHDGMADLVGVRPDGSAWYCANLRDTYPTTPFQACVPTTPVSWNSYDLAAL